MGELQRLPLNVREDLDKKFIELAAKISAPLQISDRFDGVAVDGSQWNIIFLGFHDGNILEIDIIDAFSI